jgi:hypothetical protein
VGSESSGLSIPFLSALVEKIPNADRNAQDGEEQRVEWLDAVLGIRLSDRITADANTGEDKVPPFPFAFRGFAALLARGGDVFH